MGQPRTVYWSSTDLENRLRRVEGQIRGIAAMVGRQEACNDILVQLAATKGALSKIIKIVEACQLTEALVEDEAVDAPEAGQVQAAIRRLIR